MEHEQFGQENDHEAAGGHHGQVEDPGQAGISGIVRAGRRKVVPDGTVQVLLSKFVIRGEGIILNLGGGTLGELKRKVGQSASLDAKKLKQ